MFYTVSEREPTHDAPYWRIDTKPYDPQISEGDRLAFKARVNPVIKRSTEDGGQERHDVVMDRKRELREAGEELPPTSEIVHDACTDWLDRREDVYGYSFDAENVRAHSHRRHEFKKHRNGRTVVLASADLEGLLQVEDPEAFRDMLFTGIGPAKAYGFGLMLVRPP